MHKIITTFLMGLFIISMIASANTLNDQKEELKQSLTQRFKFENLRNIRNNYEKEIAVLETQYQRNKQIDDFQKRQRPDAIKTSVYTSPFSFISSKEWDEGILNYSQRITITKIPRRTTTEVIFHFPELPTSVKNNLITYRLEAPVIKVASVLLSSGKLLPIDKVISPKFDEQSITIPTDNATILKINLEMDYQIPNELSSKVILTRDNPSSNNISLLPSFDNVVLIQLNQDLINSIINIDATDDKGNTLASKTSEKTNDINYLSTQALRIELIKGFLKAMDDKKINNNQEAIDYFVNHSDAYLTSLNNPIRQLAKSFSGNIEQVIIYITDQPINKKQSFAIY